MQKLVNKCKRELENKSALLIPVLNCETLSIFGSLNQYEHGGSFMGSISLYNLKTGIGYVIV